MSLVGGPVDYVPRDWLDQAHENAAAHIDRLRKENRQARERNALNAADAHRFCVERDQARAEVERLRKKIRKLERRYEDGGAPCMCRFDGEGNPRAECEFHRRRREEARAEIEQLNAALDADQRVIENDQLQEKEEHNGRLRAEATVASLRARIAEIEGWMYPVLARPAEKAGRDAVAELHSAAARFGPMASAHEGFAVILEELDELWAEVKGGQDRDRLRAEAIQVAAMALRFVVDVCDAPDAALSREKEPTDG